MWLFVALLAYVILAVVGIMDKIILAKSVPKPIVFVFYSTVFVIPLFFFLPFGVSLPNIWTDHLIFAISGICFALALWAMFIGFQKSEISHVGPLVGAAVPFFVLLLSYIFLHEKLTATNLTAIFVLIMGSLLISFETSRRHNGWHRGMAWGVLAGLLFGISHVASKYAYDSYGFYNGFIWTKLWIGVFGGFLLFSPSVRAIFVKNTKVFSSLTQESKQVSSPLVRLENKNLLDEQIGRPVLIFTNKFLGVIGVVLIQYAMALGSVSLVNALAGVQYGLLVILVAIISKFWPNIIKETYSKKEIVQETVAVLIIGFGLFLLIK